MPSRRQGRWRLYGASGHQGRAAHPAPTRGGNVLSLSRSATAALTRGLRPAARARARRVAVKPEYPRPLVALTAPRRPRRPPGVRRGQFGGCEPRRQHRVRVPYSAGVRTGEGRQRLQRPICFSAVATEGRAGPLGARQPAVRTQFGEKLIQRPTAVSPLGCGWRLRSSFPSDSLAGPGVPNRLRRSR